MMEESRKPFFQILRAGIPGGRLTRNAKRR
jgi:hypothetical protein